MKIMHLELNNKSFTEICLNLPLRDFETNLPLLFYVMAFFDTVDAVQLSRHNPDMIIYYLDIRDEDKLEEVRSLLLSDKYTYVIFIIDWIERFRDNKKMEMFRDDASRICRDWKSIS